MPTITNLNNTATMTALYNDLKLFFQKAGAFPGTPVVLHVEPDFWGYMEQRSTGDNATTVSAKVSETGIPQLAGLPSNVAGFARAVVKLRDTYAPNVILGYHVSVWGTNFDIALSNPSDAMVDTLASRAAAFYNSLGANFDIAFAEFSDRDSGFYQYVYGDSGRSWWDAEDFRRNVRFLAGFSAATHKRIVMWQIPLGNTRMRAENNTNDHYQDNRPEWLLDEPARTHLTAYRDAGVVAFLFGRGAGGPTCACDDNGDGVTNPAPINGNTMASEMAAAGTPPAQVTRGSTPTLVTPYAADDDGGFFRWKAWQDLPDWSSDAGLCPAGAGAADEFPHRAVILGGVQTRRHERPRPHISECGAAVVRSSTTWRNVGAGVVRSSTTCPGHLDCSDHQLMSAARARSRAGSRAARTSAREKPGARTSGGTPPTSNVMPSSVA